MPQLYHLTPAYVEALRQSTATSDFVVASHPYLLPAIQEVSNIPIWYEAQDVEIELKKNILSNNVIGTKLLEATHKVEYECCRVSTMLMVCCQDDAKVLNRIYGVNLDKIVEVPNGIALETVNYISLEERILKKKTWV